MGGGRGPTPRPPSPAKTVCSSVRNEGAPKRRKTSPAPPPLPSVDPRKIDNPTLRSLFETAVDLGTEVSAKAEKLVATVREAK